MFEQVFKNIDDILWKDAGCGSELDYIEQTSWLLFLKYLDDYELSKQQESQLGTPYKAILKKQFRWSVWAAPKTSTGQLDHDRALTGDDLKQFVNDQLFNYLKGFKSKGKNYNTLEYKVGEIFSEIKNKIHSGRNLRDVINQIDKLRFNSQAEQHEMSHLYESNIKNMGNAGRNGGEYYTPRTLIKSIVGASRPPSS